MRDAQLYCKLIQLHRLLAGRHRKEETPRLFVAQEQVLGADRLHARMMQIRFGAGEHGGMFQPLIREAVTLHEGEEILLGEHHLNLTLIVMI